MLLFVNDTLIAYIENLCYCSSSGDPSYISAFDIDQDGHINGDDVQWFLDRRGSWVDVGPSAPPPEQVTNWFVVGAYALGALILGYLL